METITCLNIVIVLSLLLKSVSSIETQFVEKGQNVTLDVQKNIMMNEDDAFIWKFNQSNNIIKYPKKNIYSEEYIGRVEFNEKDFSLLMMNIQEEDTGLYTAVVSSDKDTIVAEHLISVQARVDPPVLTSDSSINGACNVTVTCRGQNNTVTSICNNSFCSEVGVQRRGADTLLSVYVSEGTIICNHSNRVSWASITKDTVELCQKQSVSPPAGGMSVCMLKIIVLSVGLVIMISAVITVYIRGRLHKQH